MTESNHTSQLNIVDLYSRVGYKFSIGDDRKYGPPLPLPDLFSENGNCWNPIEGWEKEGDCDKILLVAAKPRVDKVDNYPIKNKTDMFFSGWSSELKLAAKVCNDGPCPVRDKCAILGLREVHYYGIWGGLSPRQRTNLLKGDELKLVRESAINGDPDAVKILIIETVLYNYMRGKDITKRSEGDDAFHQSVKAYTQRLLHANMRENQKM